MRGYGWFNLCVATSFMLCVVISFMLCVVTSFMLTTTNTTKCTYDNTCQKLQQSPQSPSLHPLPLPPQHTHAHTRTHTQTHTHTCKTYVCTLITAQPTIAASTETHAHTCTKRKWSGQNPIYTVCSSVFLAGNHQIYNWCIYTVYI